MRRLEMSYSDIMRMPTFERRFYIQMYREEMEKQEEELKEIKNNKKSGGKGTRSSTISGEALKSRMKNNQIPQQ